MERYDRRSVTGRVVAGVAAGAILLGAALTPQVREYAASVPARIAHTLERVTEDAYAPHMDHIRETAVGYVELEPEPNQGVDALVRRAWPVSTENERNALRRVVADINNLEGLAITDGESYLFPVHPDFAKAYGLNTEQ